MTDNRTTERVDHPPRVREAIDELMREKDATDNRTTELLPCPFCGGKASTYEEIPGGYIVQCHDCCGQIGIMTRERAIAAWNARADTEYGAIPATDENMAKHGWVRERTCELEINIDMTAIQCDRCGYKLPKGTDLEKVRFCAGCGAKVMGE